jgi:hypothetical protein
VLVGVPPVLAQLAPYELRNLAPHLVDSGRADLVHRLLALETPPDDGPRNAWFVAKEAIGDGDGYAADIALAARCAATVDAVAIEAGAPASEVGLEVRYALMTVALTSMTANVAGELLVELVRSGRWPIGHAIATAHRQPDARKRGRALTLLSDVAGPSRRSTLELGLASVTELTADASDEWELANERAAVLALLAPRLPDDLLPDALALAREITDRGARCRTLVALALRLDASTRRALLREALDAIALDMGPAFEAVGELARAMPDDLVQEAAARAWAIDYPYQRYAALVALLDRLPRATRAEVMDAVRSDGGLSEEHRLELLVTAAAQLAPSERGGLVQRIRAVTWGSQRIELWAALVPHLSGQARAAALDLALGDADAIDPEAGHFAVRDVATIIPIVPAGERRDHILAVGIESLRRTQDNAKHDAVARLAPMLGPEHLGAALEIGRTFGEEYFWSLQARALIALARVDPDAADAADLERIRARTETMRSDENRGYVLAALAEIGVGAPRAAPNSSLPELGSSGPGEVARVAGVAISALPGAVDRLLARWRVTEDPRLLDLIAPRLRRGLAAAAIDVASEGDDHFLAGRLLTQLLPYVNREDRLAIADRVLALDARAASTFFPDVVGLLPSDRVDTALARAREVSDGVERASLLSTLRPRLAAAAGARVLDEIIAACEPEEQYRNMLAYYARLYCDAWSDAQLARVTAIGRARTDPEQRFDTLHALLPRRLASERTDALVELLAAARQIDAFSDRRDRLLKIAPDLAALPRPLLFELWHPLITDLSGRRREAMLADLTGLAAIVAALGGTAAVRDAARAVQQVGAWWP